MIANLPPWLQDLKEAWPMVLSIIAGVGWIMRSWRNWMRTNVSGPIEETRHLVKYHLGTNDTTKPIHERLCDLERANGLPPTPQGDE